MVIEDDNRCQTLSVFTGMNFLDLLNSYDIN